MNSYELSRKWYEFCGQNSDKINPSYHALYFWIIEKANRLRWPDSFALPTDEAMHYLGISSYKTYTKIFEGLSEFGFIEIVSRSKNQYTSNRIKVVSLEIVFSESEQSEQSNQSPPKKEKAKKEIEPKKVWGEYVEGKGDGELHSMMSEFYHKDPNKYEAEMYQEFLMYWTAPIQKGVGKGKEKWRAMDTFQVSGRLATWAKNYKPKESKVNGKKSEWDANQTLREAFAIVEAKYASTG